MKRSNQISYRLARATTMAVGALWIADFSVVAARGGTSTNTSGAVLQGQSDGGTGTPSLNNAATTISFSGQTALRNFDTSSAIQQLQPGTSITLHNGVNGAAVTYYAPSDAATNVKLASNNFSTADVWKLNGVQVPVSTANAQTATVQTNSALRLEWHEQGSIDGFYDLINDEIGFPQTSTEATNAGVDALGTLRPVGSISVLSQRVPSSANPTWVNSTSSSLKTNQFTGATSGAGSSPQNGFVLDSSPSDALDQTYNNAVYDPATGRNLQNGQNRIQFSVGEYPTEAFSVSGTSSVFNFAGSPGYGQGNPALAKASTLTALGVAGQRQQFQPAEITNETTAIKDPQTGLNYPTGPWNTASTNNITSTNIAVTAVTYSANPGTGLYRLTQGDSQWLQTTGRLENGALFNVVARTVDTGQRVVFALNTGVDPSWAVGSNDDGNSTGSNAIPQHSIGPSLRFDGKTAGSEADVTIGANRLAIGALSVPEAKTATNGAVVRSLDINFNAQTDVNPSDDNLSTYIRPTFNSIVSDGTSDPNTGGTPRYQAVLISHYNTVKAPSPSALLAQEHADGILVGDNAAADSTNTSLVSAAVQQTEWAKVNSFNQNNLSDPTTSGIKGDVQYANGSTVVGGDVAAFISNIANSNAVVASGVGSVTNNANNPADGLLSIGFLPPTLLDWTRTTDGGPIAPNVATGTTLTQQQSAQSNYGTFFTLDGTSGANANTATSGLFYGGNGTNGNGLAINGNVFITAKNADGSGASNGAIVPAGNYLFGNFNQNGVRDYSAVKQSVNAALSLFAVDGAKNSIFTTDGGALNSATIPSLVGTPGWANVTANGGLANTKGDLIVLGDFNGDGKFDGTDIYLLAIGASLADSTSVDTLSATAATFSDVVRDANKVLRKNSALDYVTNYLATSATPAGAAFLKTTGRSILTVPTITNAAGATALGATAIGLDPVTGFEQFTFDPNGNYTFDKHDVNRDGTVDFNDAILVDKFAGQTYGYAQTTTNGFNTALTNTLAATQQTPVNGTPEAVSLVAVQQIDGEAAIGAADLAELNIGLATNGPTNWYAYTLAKTGTGTINFAKTAGTVTVFAATGTGPATFQINGGTVNVGKATLNGSNQPAQTGTLTTIAGAIDPFTDSTATGLDTTKSLTVTVTGATTTLDYAARTGTAGDTGIKLYRLNSLTVQNGATVKLDSPAASANHSVLVTSGLTILDTAKVDLGANDLIVRNGSLTPINTELKAGFNAHIGYWNGTGAIVSTAAANDSRYLTTIGYRQSDGSAFDGQPTATTDVLVKYTYYGDANLDGTVNGADYQHIDAGFGTNATDWSHGDFNYDGVINGSDFALIDNTFNQITATNAGTFAVIALSSIPLASNGFIAAPANGIAGVPEPSSLSLLAISAAGVLSKRRRRD